MWFLKLVVLPPAYFICAWHDLHQLFSIPVPPPPSYFACLSFQIISSLEVCSVHELCSDWHAPYTQWPLLPTPSAGEIRCSLLIASLHHCMLQRQSMYATNDVRKASVHYNQLWSITELIPNRPRLHRDAPWKRLISTPLTATCVPSKNKKCMTPLVSLLEGHISHLFFFSNHIPLNLNGQWGRGTACCGRQETRSLRDTGQSQNT